MAPNAVAIRPNTDTKQLEVQSLAQTQQLMRTIFACIAYLRDIFPEDVFEDDVVAGMNLKRIKSMINGKRHSSSFHAHNAAAKFVEWIEKGCFDAMAKKYLKSVMMTIGKGPNDPVEQILETYTLRISYPNSPDHLHDKLSQCSLTLEMENETGEGPLSFLPTPNTFKSSMAKLLRTLCINSQTLTTLPECKSINMHLTYYDDLTPVDYEPPGFSNSVFDLDHLFGDHGTAKLVYGTMTLTMEALEAVEEEQEGKGGIITATGNADYSNVAINGIGPSTQQLIEQETKMTNEPPPASHNSPPVLTEELTKCMCGDPAADLGMIQCDRCKAWEHVVCAGYFSNQDKRLLSLANSERLCYHCQYIPCPPDIRTHIRDLCRLRRALSIIYNEGFQNCHVMARRMAMSMFSMSALCRRLEQEGFLKVTKGKGNTNQYEVLKTLDAKARIKQYYSQDYLNKDTLFQSKLSRKRQSSQGKDPVQMQHEPKIVESQKTMITPKKRRKQSSAAGGYISCQA